MRTHDRFCMALVALGLAAGPAARKRALPGD